MVNSGKVIVCVCMCVCVCVCVVGGAQVFVREVASLGPLGTNT